MKICKDGRIWGQTNKEASSHFGVLSGRKKGEGGRRVDYSETRKGAGNPMFGKHHSEETKKKMSVLNTGKHQTEEAKKKISEAKKGKGMPWIAESNKRRCGDKSHLWRGGITAENILIRGRIEYRLWREAVFARDNYTCQECEDKSGGNLNAHHIKAFSQFPDLRVDISNGVTLCEKCHGKIPKNPKKTKEMS